MDGIQVGRKRLKVQHKKKKGEAGVRRHNFVEDERSFETPADAYARLGLVQVRSKEGGADPTYRVARRGPCYAAIKSGMPNAKDTFVISSNSNHISSLRNLSKPARKHVLSGAIPIPKVCPL